MKIELFIKTSSRQNANLLQRIRRLVIPELWMLKHLLKGQLSSNGGTYLRSSSVTIVQWVVANIYNAMLNGEDF